MGRRESRCSGIESGELSRAVSLGFESALALRVTAFGGPERLFCVHKDAPRNPCLTFLGHKLPSARSYRPNILKIRYDRDRMLLNRPHRQTRLKAVIDLAPGLIYNGL